MLVRQLNKGQKFRIDLGRPYGHIDYRLIYANDCRAYVESLTRTKKKVVTSDGDVAEFDAPGGRMNIAPTTECELIDEELEDLMGTTPVTPPKRTTTTSAGTKTRGGDRNFAAAKQQRPVREGTIRHKLLEQLKAGKTDINKLMKEFDMDRSLLIAHVHEMNKCHGYGYSIVGDAAKIVMPVGGELKGKPAGKPVAKKAAGKPAVADDLDDLL